MAELYCGLRGGMISVYDIHNQKVKVNQNQKQKQKLKNQIILKKSWKTIELK